MRSLVSVEAPPTLTSRTVCLGPGPASTNRTRTPFSADAIGATHTTPDAAVTSMAASRNINPVRFRCGRLGDILHEDIRDPGDISATLESARHLRRNEAMNLTRRTNNRLRA